ncbi:Major facilitator superfamily domain general substrate transporter [Penicillium cf. griseofulvum]|uniref:Major facilitator superfamily domain general substrate transporter n=1 Tax=Penicillium cf. griseofulvum TaxID=2972120 RepID=A0A9W9J2E9_9EURO|nr:Major facilitator superfamily domain general substrate transporter [Penicillium cf. griseofulvum]KAJ5434142.1 Major facilitator superfamily domain general substrate transporter [Penicillium cf. griseofulvum]
MYSHIQSEGTPVSIAHCKAQILPVVDRILEPQTIAHFIKFAFGEHPLPNGNQADIERLSPDEISFIQHDQTFPPGTDGEPIMTSVMARIGSTRDSSRLCLVGKNIQSLKSRLWEGIIPLNDQLWQEKGLDRPEHFDFACQHLSAVIAVFQYLNEPTVRLYLRDTFNYIYDHWATLDTVLNKRREEQNKKPVSVAALWTTFMSAHFEMMSERAHRWVTVHVNTLRAPLLRALLEYQPVGGDLSGEPDDMQWKITDSLHMLTELTAQADFTIMIPMNGYKGHFADPPRMGPASLHAANLQTRRKAYHERLKLLTREAISRNASVWRGLIPTSGEMYSATSYSQIQGQNKLRKEVRGAPIEPVPREPWIAACALEMESGKKEGKEEKYGLAVYRLTYGQTESEWTEFVRKVEAHVSDWGKGQTGSSAIKEHLKLHWLDGKELGIPEDDVDAAKQHFKNDIKGSDDWSMLQGEAFLVVDSASFASYTTNSYSPVTSRFIPGDFAGFLLAIDPTFDPEKGIERPDESPGYNGQMRILGSLVWSDLYSLLSAQTFLLEDYWPLASEHPNMVYVGPTIPWQRFIWQNHNEMRWILIRAVINYVKLNPVLPAMPTPIQAQDTFSVTSPTAAISAGTPETSSSPSSTPPEQRDPLNTALREYMLTEFQRYLRHQGQPRSAAMVNELLHLQPGEEPDGARLRQLVDDENERQEQRRRDGLGEDEEASTEYNPECPLQ